MNFQPLDLKPACNGLKDNDGMGEIKKYKKGQERRKTRVTLYAASLYSSFSSEQFSC